MSAPDLAAYSSSLPALNPRLDLLQPYPFERLRQLLAGVDLQAPGRPARPVNLSIGEPKHPTPAVVLDAFSHGLGGLASYPATAGSDALKASIAQWIRRRHGVTVNPATEVLPINGSREALFAFAQVVIDPSTRRPRRICIVTGRRSPNRSGVRPNSSTSVRRAIRPGW